MFRSKDDGAVAAAGGRAPSPPQSPSPDPREGELESLPLERIETEIAELAAHIYAATCRWLELVAEFDRRNGHEAQGFHECSTWLAWRCGVSPRTARDHVRIARALVDLPAVRASFSRGQLSYSKVKALTRVATPECEGELLELARHATAAQLERIVRSYRRVSLADAERAHERRHLSYHWDDDGSLRISAQLDPEEGAAFLRALDAAHKELRADSEGDSPLPQSGGFRGPAGPHYAPDEADEAPKPTRVDAFVTMVDRGHVAGDAQASGGDRHQVVLHVDAERLVDDDGNGRCGVEDGPAISSETARRLACDSSLVVMREGEKATVSVGRKTRTIPPSLRRALRARDGGCRFPGCTHHRFTDAHHIHHWALGGETALDNLVTLCRRHHRLLHEGGFAVERRAGGVLLFRRPNGEELAAVPTVPRGRADAVPAANRETGLEIDHETCASLSAGEPYDLEMTVDGLLRLIGPEPP